jgi:hypothetical protein
MVDLEKDRLDGSWQSAGGVIQVHGPHGGGKCVVPVIPQGSYELQVLFKAPPNSTGFVLPVESRAVAIVLGSRDGKAHELLDVDPATGGPGKTIAQGTRIQGFCLLHARVQINGETADVAVALDRKSILRWRGPTAALSLPPVWDLGVPGVIGLGGIGSSAQYRRIQLRVLTGRAVLMR